MTGRPPIAEAWPRGSAHHLAAKRARYGVLALVKATEALDSRRPSLQELYNLTDRVDALLRALEQLALPEGDAPAPRPAKSIAANCADTSRALVGVTSGWRRYLPDLSAQHAARRLCTEFYRLLTQLDAIERQHDTKEFP